MGSQRVGYYRKQLCASTGPLKCLGVPLLCVMQLAVHILSVGARLPHACSAKYKRTFACKCVNVRAGLGLLLERNSNEHRVTRIKEIVSGLAADRSRQVIIHQTCCRCCFSAHSKVRDYFTSDFVKEQKSFYNHTE